MKTYKLFQALLVLILVACSSAVQGQYNTSTVMSSSQYNATTVGYPTATQNATSVTAQYAQFYTMNTGKMPSSLVSTPQPYNITGNMPTKVYFSNQMQSVPFSQYQANPTAFASNSLWIKGSTAWSQYAAVPVGANVQLLAISPSGGGSGSLNIMGSSGQTSSYNYFFYPSSLLSLYAATPGRYMLTFTIGGASSNPVVIDVAGTMTMTYTPMGYYTSGTTGYSNPQAALDLADAAKANQKLNSTGTYEWLGVP